MRNWKRWCWLTVGAVFVGVIVVNLAGCAAFDAFRATPEGQAAIGSGINAGAGLLKDVVPFPFNQLIGPAGSLLTLLLTGGRKD